MLISSPAKNKVVSAGLTALGVFAVTAVNMALQSKLPQVLAGEKKPDSTPYRPANR